MRASLERMNACEKFMLSTLVSQYYGTYVSMVPKGCVLRKNCFTWFCETKKLIKELISALWNFTRYSKLK